MVHSRLKYVIVAGVVGLALAGCDSHGGTVQMAPPATKTVPAPVQAAVRATSEASGTQSAVVARPCPAQVATWTSDGPGVSVKVNVSRGVYVAVSVDEGAGSLDQAAASTGGTLNFSFHVAAARVDRVLVRFNESGCEVQKVMTP